MTPASDLDALAEQLYANPDPGMRQSAYERLNSLTLEGSDAGAFYTILQQSSSQYSLLFAAQGLVTWFKNNLKYLSQDARRKLVLGDIGDCLLRLAEGGAPQHILSSMLVTYARLTKLAFLKEPYLVEAAQFPLEMLQSSTNVEEGSLINDEAVNSVNRLLGLTLLDTMVNEFSNFDSSKSKTYLSFSEHRRCSNNFRDACLRTLFEASLRELERVHAGSLRGDNPSSNGGKTREAFFAEKIVNLVKNCLCFDFMAIIVDETEEALSAQIPTSWRDLVLTESTQCLLWGQHAALPYPLCGTLFAGLSALCGTRRTFFDEAEQRVQFLDFVLEQMTKVGELQDGRLRIPHYANLYAEACARFVTPFGYRDLHSSAWFAPWLEVVRQVSVDVFSVPFGAEGSFTTASTFLSFWARLTTSRRMYLSAEQETLEKDLENIAPSLVLTFFQSRVYISSEANRQPGRDNSSFDPTDDFDSALETVLNQAESFATLALLEIPATMELLAGYAAQQLGSRLFDDPTATGWLFFLAGSLARHVFANLDASAAVTMCVNFFSYCVNCANYCRSLSSQKGSNNPSKSIFAYDSAFRNFVERGLLHFLINLNAILSTQQMTHSIGLVIEGLFQSRERFFQFMLSSSGHNMLRDGSNDEVVIDIMRKSIDLISDVVRDIPTSMLDTISLDLPPVVDLPLAHSMHTYKLRTNLYTALGHLALKKCCEFSTLQGVMTPIVNCIQNTRSGSEVGKDPLFIAGWMCDLRGVAIALEANAESEIVIDFIQWFCDESITFEEILTGPSIESPLLVNNFLHLMIEIVNNRGVGMLPHGCSHSPLALCLFKHLCRFIQIIVERSITDERVRAVTAQNVGYPSDKAYDLMMKPLTLSMACLRRCLGGSFVPLGAMWYYNDDTYDTVLLGLLRMLIVFPPNLFKEYAKAAHAVMDLLAVLTENDYYLPLRKLSTEELQAIISLALTFCEDIQTQTGTLLHGIRFLGFIAAFVKDVKAVSLPAESRARDVTGYNSPGNPSPAAPMQLPTYYAVGTVGRIPSVGAGAQGTSRSARAAREAIARLLEPIGDLWQRLLSVAMGIIVCQDRVLSGSCAVIYPILETHPPLWYEFVEQFAATYPEHKHPKVREALSLLTNASESYEKFFSEVFSFRQMMRSL